jgi:uncharacterized membrane protein
LTQEVVTTALESWASLYSNHAALRTAIGFLHVGGLVLSGGIAISTDRLILVSRRRDEAERTAQLQALRRTHRAVVIALGVVIISGLLLFAADSGTFLHSVLFWLKMGFFVLLLANGLLLIRAERSAETGDTHGWNRLAIFSIASITLWLLTTLLGSALPNIG